MPLAISDVRRMEPNEELRAAIEAELCWNLGDGVNQAADFSWLATSIPSRNVTPRTSFGN
jgi:hypothetical protein